ncbi:MAG: autotransporter assembly complex protein TamA [Pseudomonadota bacterium]
MTKFIKTLLVVICLTGSGAVLAAETVEVGIDGVEGRVLDNVREFLSIEQQKSDPDLNEARIRRLHRNASEEIKQALEPFGYYDPSIRAELTRENEIWRANYHIDPGTPVRVENIDIRVIGEDEKDEEFQKLARDFPLRKGDILEHGRYESGKRAFQALAAERGYLNAHLPRHEIKVRLEQHAADITLHFDTGPRYRFGKITFIQPSDPEKSYYDPEFLARYSLFKPGDPYSTARLFELQNALSDSDYFASVEVKTRRDQIQDREIPVEVTLEPRNKHRYLAGIGYGTDTGARGTLGWENRHVTDSGHLLRADLRLSEIKSNFIARYRIPTRNPRTDRIEFISSWLYNNPVTSKSETLLVGASHTVFRGSGWLETMYLNYQMENFTVGDQSGQSNMLLPGISWSRVDADSRIYTRHGTRLLLDIKGTDPLLGSNTRFLQVRAQGKLIRPLGEKGRVILRGDAGVSYVGEFAKLPASLRFFTGGDQTIRGYGYNTLGPIDPRTGKVVGGEQLLVGSAEYEYSLTEKWSGAVFFDVGNALDDWRQKFKKGTGVGARWKTPIGLVRVDVAWAISEPGDPWKFHLVIGPDL